MRQKLSQLAGKKITVLAGAICATVLLGGSVAHAETSNEKADAKKVMVSCESGGMVGNITQHAPRGVYGGAWIKCFRPYPETALRVNVTLFRDGSEMAHDIGHCYGKDGCSASAGVVPNPSGSQRWCAKVVTNAVGVPVWRGTYCSHY
jgi:hypothetical protein